MRVIAKRTLVKFWERNKEAEQPLLAWHDIVKEANWKNFNDVKTVFKNSSIVGNDRLVFNIKGNDYRLVVKADFKWRVFYIRFIGTHKEYDKLDIKNI